MQFNNGILDEETFQAYLEPLNFIFNSNAGREFVLSKQFSGNEEFEDYVIEYLGLNK
jgi:hypothetical protein